VLRWRHRFVWRVSIKCEELGTPVAKEAMCNVRDFRFRVRDMSHMFDRDILSAMCNVISNVIALVNPVPIPWYNRPFVAITPQCFEALPQLNWNRCDYPYSVRVSISHATSWFRLSVPPLARKQWRVDR